MNWLGIRGSRRLDSALGLHDVQDDGYSVLVVVSHQALVRVHGVCPDQAVPFLGSLRVFHRDSRRKDYLCLRLQGQVFAHFKLLGRLCGVTRLGRHHLLSIAGFSLLLTELHSTVSLVFSRLYGSSGDHLALALFDWVTTCRLGEKVTILLPCSSQGYFTLSFVQ